LGAAFVRM